MKRLLGGVDVVNTDILVVGGGLAGCVSAIKAALRGQSKVLLVDKGHLGKSGSSVFAAGVINVCTSEDDPDLWLKEIVVRGEYLNDQEWVKTLLEETAPLTTEIEGWGRELAGKPLLRRDGEGKLIRIQGRGMQFNKVCMVEALAMMETLARKVKKSGVDVMNRVMVTDILVSQGRVVGAVGLDYRNERIIVFLCKSLIMAASGCGFKSFFLGHKNLTGEAHKTAYENGVTLRHFDHANANLTAKIADICGLNLMIGLGGRFINGKGEEFLSHYDPQLGNFALMPTLAVSFCLENEAGRGPIFLDLSRISAENRTVIGDLLPEAMAVLETTGVRPFSDPIEYIPAFFGSIVQGGGIHIDTSCASSLPGLFAVGDSSCNPMQGTASVGGLNLAFAIVSGARAARSAGDYSQSAPSPEMDFEAEDHAFSAVDRIKSPLRNGKKISPDEVLRRIQNVMLRGDTAFLVDEKSLKKGLQELDGIKERVGEMRATDGHELVKALEVRSMATVGEIILRSKLFRQESRGFLYRRDFPFTNNKDWLKWVMVKKEGSTGEMRLSTSEFPTPYLRPSEEMYPRFPVKGLEQE